MVSFIDDMKCALVLLLRVYYIKEYEWFYLYDIFFDVGGVNIWPAPANILFTEVQAYSYEKCHKVPAWMHRSVRILHVAKGGIWIIEKFITAFMWTSSF